MDLASAILEKNLERLCEHLDRYEFAYTDTAELASGAITKNWVAGLEAILAKCPLDEDSLNLLVYATFRKPTHWECLRLVLTHPQLNGEIVREIYAALVQGITNCPSYQSLIEAEFPHRLHGWAHLLPPVQLVKGVVPPPITRALEFTGDQLHPSQIAAALDMGREEAKSYISALLPYCDPLDMLREALYTSGYSWVLEYVCGELHYDPKCLVQELRPVLQQLESYRPKSQPGPTMWDHLDSVRG